MGSEKRSKKGISELRETECRKWSRNPEIILCLKSIMVWSKCEISTSTNVYENLYDWVNNIVWYSNMQDIDPVFGRSRPYAKRGS